MPTTTQEVTTLAVMVPLIITLIAREVIQATALVLVNVEDLHLQTTAGPATSYYHAWNYHAWNYIYSSYQ